MYKLHALKAPEIVKQVTARLPIMGQNERFEFLSYTHITNELDDAHHMSLKPYYPKVNTRRRAATLAMMRDEEGFNMRDENAMDLESGEEMFERRMDIQRQENNERLYGSMY